ncbi:MAG: deoxyribose-phosphate aldolase [Bacteroidetes bacterium]|uniref:Deoxyribose-phosphate aldolase n=1 Tax=Candidatus Egerieousia excrementavium TaxID=2840778 RepID=A0A9D9DM21_9BACT|nr:deoxyribose-phosphate aldolase [Candidatus Egerieousia excrementavium]
MKQILEKYGYAPDMEAIDRILTLIQNNLGSYESAGNLAACMGLIDLTSLNSADTEAKIAGMTQKVNMVKSSFPEYPAPAAICVYPNFAECVKKNLTVHSVKTAVVAGAFPHSQSFDQVKKLECKMAAESADEIDIVLPLHLFLAGEYEKTADSIREIKEILQEKTLKVILETGVLASPTAIAAASFLAMEAGADFIKTSTGKLEPAATPMAAIIMCDAIKRYYIQCGRKVGFKAAGGMTATKDALCYYSIVDTILGKEWLNKEYFRLGTSRLANAILSELEEKTVNYY